MNAAFIHLLHRFPRTAPVTSPDSSKSELAYNRDVLAAQQAVPANLRDEAVAALPRCPRNAGCALLQNAGTTLQAGYRALAPGDTRAAAFDAQRAYNEATLALRIA